jgi:hypothetical protein
VVCTLASGRISEKTLPISFPAKKHLLVLLGKQVDVNLAGKIKNGWNFFWCIELKESMAGKYSETVGTCSKLAGTCFTIRKTKFQSKFQQEKGPELE